MRGFFTGNGLPNLAISARNIIKDYITGVLKYAKHPPGYRSTLIEKKEEEIEEIKEVDETEVQDYNVESNMKKKDAERERQVDDVFFGD